MKKFVIMLAVSVVLLVANIGIASDLDLCVKNTKAGRYPQAIALCQKFTTQFPDNATGWYELGNVYILTGQYSAGENAFKSAVQLSPVYAQKVGNFYKIAGYDALKMLNVDNAASLFSRYLDYQPNQRAKLADDLLAKGMGNAAQGFWQLENAPLALASLFKPSHRPAVCEMYMSEGNKAADGDCLDFYLKAKNFCNVVPPSVGERLMKIAKGYARHAGQEDALSKIKPQLKNFIDKSTIDNELSEEKIYEPGTYTFTIKAGEQLEHWIRFPLYQKTTFWTKPDSKDYLIVYSDGDIYPGDTEKMPNKTSVGVKLRAINDVEIKFYVK